MNAKEMKLAEKLYDDMVFDENIRDGIWKHKTETYTEFFRHCHGDMLPDDHRYEIIHKALDILVNCEYEDDYTEGIDNHVSVYNHELLNWLSSHLDRVTYVDEAIEDYGYNTDYGIMQSIMQGYYRELEEVLYLAKDWIEEHADEDELLDDDEDD